jgi:tetratricopeptide (TPR) repeat protein
LAASRRHADAIEAYSSALAIDPGHIEARCSRGLAFQQIGEHVRAIADFDEVISSYPNWAGSFAAYYGRAGSRQALGQNIEAIEDCDEAIRRNSRLIDSLYLRGMVRKAIGDVEAAINDMNAVLKADAGYREAYFVRGGLHCLRQSWEQAVEDLTAAIELGVAETENGRACFYLRGMAAQELGEHHAAIADFARTIELVPDDGAAYLRRSRSYHEIGESALAAADIRTGTRLMHDQ